MKRSLTPPVEPLDTSASSIREPKRRDTYRDPWYPEDATVEVWCQDGDDLSAAIKLSLEANSIHCCCDSDKPGVKRIFVRPEDEPFAREIIREIVEATLLK
jgi:hypothetical protein